MGEDPDCEPRYLNFSLGFAGSELVQRTELKYLVTVLEGLRKSECKRRGGKELKTNV